MAYTTSAFLLWMTGYPDRAVERAISALELAGRLNHPFTTAYALFHVGLLDLWRGELDLVKKRASDVLVVAEEHDYQVWKAVALVLHGVALSGLGHAEEGIEESERGVVQYQGLKTPPIFWPVLLSLRASAFALAGRSVEGMETVDTALEITGENDMLSTSLALLKGDMLAALSDLDGARGWYRKSLEVAHAWGARMPQLQAATRLVRLGPGGEDGQDGTETLRSIYDTFTEGFGTHDLLDARSLLERSSDRP